MPAIPCARSSALSSVPGKFPAPSSSKNPLFFNTAARKPGIERIAHLDV